MTQQDVIRKVSRTMFGLYDCSNIFTELYRPNPYGTGEIEHYANVWYNREGGLFELVEVDDPNEVKHYYTLPNILEYFIKTAIRILTWQEQNRRMEHYIIEVGMSDLIQIKKKKDLT